MSIGTRITHFIGAVAWEKPTANTPLRDLNTTLQRDGESLYKNLAALGDKPRHRDILSHIVGIERWGQNRLEVLLGKPFVQDEYDGYRPARETSYTDLLQQFQETRAHTVALAQRVVEANKENGTVPHNMFGDLSAKGWVRYLNLHANSERYKMLLPLP
jgi:hypothetical protein